MRINASLVLLIVAVVLFVLAALDQAATTAWGLAAFAAAFAYERTSDR